MSVIGKIAWRSLVNYLMCNLLEMTSKVLLEVHHLIHEEMNKGAKQEDDKKQLIT